MSLNGLDSPAVQDAYQTALAEAGGWSVIMRDAWAWTYQRLTKPDRRFLLKYASRDSVELLSRGKGGVHEARYALANYEEKSPLYGLIAYRRRKVLIKFIPEGTSRVLLGEHCTRRKPPISILMVRSSDCRTFPGCNRKVLAIRHAA